MSGSRPAEAPALESPARVGALWLVARALAVAAAEARRLDDLDDLEAVHDFRVAVRRLRTFLRTYADVLGIDDDVQDKLRELTAATNTTRDSEAHAEWCEQRLADPELDPHVRAALERLATRVRSSVTRPPDPAVTAQRTLDRVGTAVLVASQAAAASEPTGASFGESTSDIVRRAAKRLRKRLSRIESLADARPLHRARLSQKRLRYVLEPIAAQVPEADSVLQRLRELQDALGELHDLSGLIERIDDRSPELRSLVEARRDELFAGVHSEWVRGAGGDVFSDIKRIREALMGHPAGKR